MTYIKIKDEPVPYWSRRYNEFNFDAPRGSFSDIVTVNKFGRTTNADSGIATDIWDGANTTEDDDVWLAPTAARVHAITSNDGGDTLAGAGAQIIRIYGLRDWDSVEFTEDVNLSGLSAVNTKNSYVIIHRIKVIQSGASGPNIGDIFATAAVDGTITAMIIAGQGQTQMAVYGIPSLQNAYMTRFYSSLNRAVATAVGNVSLLASVNCRTRPKVFQVKHTSGLSTTGSNSIAQVYTPWNRFTGPVVLKLRITTGQDNCDVSGGFDLILEDK